MLLRRSVTLAASVKVFLVQHFFHEIQGATTGGPGASCKWVRIPAKEIGYSHLISLLSKTGSCSLK